MANLRQTIADLERQLAECRAERDEALQRETATAEVLQVINSSPGNLVPVFDAILEKALRLCGAAYGHVFRVEGDLGRAVAARGDPEFVEWLLKQEPVRPTPGGILHRMRQGERVVQIPDSTDTEAYRAGTAIRELIDRSGVRTTLGIALRTDSALLGAIFVNRREVRPFSDKEIALLENFAAQAVIAMENARLLTETREALEQQTATADVLQVINSSPGDLAPVFDAILEKAHSLCRVEYGALQLSDGEKFRAVAIRGYPETFEQSLRRPHSLEGPLRALLHGVHLVEIPDVIAHQAEAPNPRAEAAIAVGIRGALFLPLRRENQLLGLISAGRKEKGPFLGKEVALLENFAAQAVIAMENARLLTETREALEQQTATAEVLQVINSSPGDLAPVFDAILEKAHSLCGATRGSLVSYDGEWFRAIATRGLPEDFAEFMRGGFPSLPTGVASRLERGEYVHISDFTEFAKASTPEIAQSVRPSLDLAGTRTLLVVPLCKDGVLLGYIAGYRTEVRPFTDKQIALLQNFAAQAVIAMENARLLTETREALEQQTATAEVLQVINSSPGDLTPVFDALLDKALDLCGAAFGNLWTFDGENFRAAALRRVPEAYIDMLSRQTVPPRPGTVLGHIAAGKAFAQIPDAALEHAYMSTDARTLVELGGGRTVVGVPLRKETSLLGAITIFRQEVKPFTEQQIEVLQNFAAQAVIAMENARLLTETREALEQQTATAEVLQVINSSPGDLTPVFDAMLEKAMRLCGFDHGSLQTFDGQEFRAVAVRGLPEPLEIRLRQGFRPAPQSPMGRLIEGDRFAQIPDLRQVEGAQFAVEHGSRSLLCVPMRKDDKLLGQIVAVRQEVRPFGEKETALLENFAAQAVIAMENARLLTETREALEQQTATAEVLQVINSSPGDLAPVFDAILEKAHTLCGAAIGALLTFDGESFGFLARKVPPDLAEFASRPFKPGPQNRLNDLIRGEALVHILDAREVLALAPEDPQLRRPVEIGGMRTFLAVPLRKDDRLIGAITAARQEVRPFTEEIALLENFAAQAVIAMENARLIGELHERTDQVAELNRGLEARVAEQVEELGRVGRLKRFLAPQLAELIVSQGNENILESHRREIVVVFCDLRGYTAFTETAEPEEVLDFLREYHGALGPLVAQFEGTLDQFSGDGIMVFFNDPVPCPDPAERAVRMAAAMREAAAALIAKWRRRGRELGFGAGIAQGYATLGQIGFAERSGYTAIGTVCNLAARLCAEAKDGQILVAQRVAVAVEETTMLEEVGALALKGLTQPVVAFNVPVPGGGAAASPRSK